MISTCNSRSSSTCLESLSSDSQSFGHALAISDDYLAVGDPEANRVIIYSRSNDDKWLRTREILPPKSSATDKVRSGFGYDVSLDKSMLVIGAYTEKHKPNNQEGFQYTNRLGVAFSGAVYRVLLNKNADVERIDMLDEGEVSGFSVSADRGKIAFSIKREEQPGRWIGNVILLSEGQITPIASPTDNGADGFGADIALKKNFLLIGSPGDGTGAAWLFDIETLPNEPQKIAVDDAHLGSTVAISEKFAVVGAVGGLTYAVSPKTLIKAIDDGSTTVTDGVGRLSLDRNVLARVRPRSSDGEQQALLELFDLSDIAAPCLVEQRENIDRALLQNSLLTTVQKTIFGVKLCIEPRIK